MQPLKVGVYLRVSTDDQVNVYEGSLESQKYRANEFVRFKNTQAQGTWGEIVDYYIEEGESAGTTNRPQYQRLMADIQRGRVNMILVTDLSRLSRNLLDFCHLINELEEHKASYLSMKEQFDTSTPIGRMMVYIIIALGQFERETTSERVSINFHTRALKGLVNGGPTLLGFDRNPEKPGMLTVNSEEAEKVHAIFQTFLEEGSRSKTVSRLHEKKIFPKSNPEGLEEKGLRKWTVQSLRSILANQSYVGLRTVNKKYKGEDPSHLKPWQQYSVVKASWPGLVDESLFLDAQCLLEEAASLERTRIGKSAKRVYLLTGLLRCGETGLPLVGQAGHSSSGIVHRYYHYVRRPKGLSEVRPRLNADDLEEKVIHEFWEALKSQGYFQDLEETLKSRMEASSRTAQAENIRLRDALHSVNERITTIWVNQGRSHWSDDALRLASEELDRLAKERRALEAQISVLDLKKFSPEAAREQALFIENRIRWCMQGWQKASAALRKRMLRRVIKEIVVTKDEIHLTLWTSLEEQQKSIQDLDGNTDSGNENLLKFRRRSRPEPDHNSSIQSSGKVKNGSGERT